MKTKTTKTKNPKNVPNLFEIRINDFFDSFSTEETMKIITKLRATNPALSEFEKDSAFLLIVKLTRLLRVLELSSVQ